VDKGRPGGKGVKGWGLIYKLDYYFWPFLGLGKLDFKPWKVLRRIRN